MKYKTDVSFEPGTKAGAEIPRNILAYNGYGDRTKTGYLRSSEGRPYYENLLGSAYPIIGLNDVSSK